MITQTRDGTYKLLQTQGKITMLSLDDEMFTWLEVEGIGEVLVAASKTHYAETVLSEGQYRLYDVDDEPNLSDQQHLELEAEHGKWKGYLLPTGLPEGKKIRSRIIPTKELIAANQG